MRYAKQFGIPLRDFYSLRNRAPEANYGGAIPLTGYTDIRGVSAAYDRKFETLFITLTAERSDAELATPAIPAELADVELVPLKPTPRGKVHTAYTRTKAMGSRALCAVPDVSENIEPGSAEKNVGSLPDKNESLLIVISPEMKTPPGFVYQEPLLTFFRDGKAFYAYVEEQSNAALPAVIGTLDGILAPFTPPQFAPGSKVQDLGNGVILVSEPLPAHPSANFKGRPASAPEVKHLGITSDGTYAQRFHIGLEGYFDDVTHDIGHGFHTHGGRIPLYGYAVQGKPVVSFDPATEKLAIDFQTIRTAEPLRPVRQSKRGEPVPDISEGLASVDAEYAPGTAAIAYHQFALIVSEHKMEGRNLGAFSSSGRNPVRTFTHNGKKHYVYLEVQTCSYENGIYDHEYRIPLEDIEQYKDGHEMWVAGHEPVFVSFEELDPKHISVRLSSNKRKIVVNAGLRRSGDFDFCKREFKDAAIGKVKRGSVEARDHGKEPKYSLGDWEGNAEFHEIIGILFSFMPVTEYESKTQDEINEWLEYLYGDGVFVGTAGGYAVFATFHID